jgi:WG containing repeat
MHGHVRLFFTAILLLLLRSTTLGQASAVSRVLILVSDSATGRYGYSNEAGELVIPMGKYPVCFTDTFRNYAIVLADGKGIVAIDRGEHVLYSVFIFDNGPDYPSDGLFRIKKGGRIGYADAVSGKISIAPQFSCASPFKKGRAKVSLDCKTSSDGEHKTWISDHWFYVNKAGVRLAP